MRRPLRRAITDAYELAYGEPVSSAEAVFVPLASPPLTLRHPAVDGAEVRWSGETNGKAVVPAQS